MWLGDEERLRFSPGGSPAVVEIDGWHLGLAICKDTGVEEHALKTAALDMDAYLAGTVKHADERDLQDQRARRIATIQDVWVVVASFAGSTGNGFEHTAGRSGVWAPGGVLVAQAGSKTGDSVQATLR